MLRISNYCFNYKYYFNDYKGKLYERKKNLELSISLHKVADILMKEDYFNNLEETIKTKNILIKELLKVIVMAYNKNREFCGVYSLGSAKDIKAYIDGTILHYDECLKIKGYEDVNSVVETLYKDFVGE